MLNWDELAVTLGQRNNKGYETEKDMLLDYQNDPNKTFVDLSNVLGVDPATLLYRRRKHKLQEKSRGGPNNVLSTNRKWERRANENGFENEKHWMEHMKEKYKTCYKIAKILNEYPSTIRKRFINLGIPHTKGMCVFL